MKNNIKLWRRKEISMANTQHPLLQCFRGDCYSLSIFMRHNLISGMEEKMIEFARLRMGVLNLDGVPFFECNRPEAFFAPSPSSEKAAI